MNKIIEVLALSALALGVIALDAVLRKPSAASLVKLNEALIDMRKGAKKQ